MNIDSTKFNEIILSKYHTYLNDILIPILKKNEILYIEYTDINGKFVPPLIFHWNTFFNIKNAQISIKNELKIKYIHTFNLIEEEVNFLQQEINDLLHGK